MTLKDLLVISPDEWDKLPDEELKAILEPFLKVTRPSKELIPRSKSASKKVTMKSSTNVQDLFNQLTSMQKQLGDK